MPLYSTYSTDQEQRLQATLCYDTLFCLYGLYSSGSMYRMYLGTSTIYYIVPVVLSLCCNIIGRSNCDAEADGVTPYS